MNSKTAIIIALVCLNIAQLVYFLKRGSATPLAGPNPPSATNIRTRLVDKPVIVSVPTNSTPQQIDWRMVESEDYKKYIANLRAIGCPEETIRDIIVADVNKLFESRKKALRAASTNKFQFWKAGNPFAAMMDEEKIRQQQELAKEKRALLKELLGIESEEKPDLFAGVNPFETMLDFLPSAKQTQVIELMQKFQAKAMKSLGGGAPDAEDLKQMQTAQKEMEGELAKILTPQELEDYQLRMSQTSMMMRMQLATFEPTEQEFRDIFKLKKKFGDEYSGAYFGMPTTDKAERDKREAAQKELDAQLKGVMGESRFTEYQRAQDWAYQGIAKVAERQGLPKEAAVKVYDMKKVAEEQVNKLRADKTLSEEKRTEALKAIRAETEKEISRTLGEKGLEAYKRQPGAYWLENLGPREPKP